MRRVLAWVLVAAGVVGIVAGALLATALRPDPRLLATARLPDPGVALVTAPGLLELTGPQVRVTVADPAGGAVFAGVAREADALAWLADARRTELTGVREGDDGTRLTTRGAGTAPRAADPREADLWLLTATGDGEAVLEWPRAPGRHVLVATTDGTAPAPQDVRMTWTRTGEAAQHPIARPLVAGGSASLLLGVALLTRRGRHRARGPRPGGAPGVPARAGADAGGRR
ncbi:hypothetical protein NUM3379_11610 [Kineococcus sp. NUM-3379]